jgi:glycosyltransferase 2 family protein
LLGLAMSTWSHALWASSFSAVSAALIPHPPSFAQHLQMVPLVLFTTVVPLPFGALGLSEQVSDSLFRMIGHPMGALVMLGFRLVSLAVGCVSITVYMTSGREIPKAAREGRIAG